MDANGEIIMLSGQLHGVVKGPHIGEHRCVRNDPILVCLNNALVDAFSQAEFVHIYDQPATHARAPFGSVSIARMMCSNCRVVRLWWTGKTRICSERVNASGNSPG